jgi:hypothetical protein
MKIKEIDQRYLIISLSSPIEKRKKIEILIDLLEEGNKTLKTKSDILILNGEVVKTKKDGFVINGPGEYEIKGVFVQGIEILTKQSSIVYTIEAEGIRTCYLGFLRKKELSAERLDEIGAVDLLVVPTNERKTLSPRELLGVISQIEPEIVVFVKAGKTKKGDGFKALLKAAGIKSFDEEKEVNIKAEELTGEGRRIVVLSS